MMYKIVKIKFEDCEEGRFFRTFAVNPDINLKEFGCAILTSLFSTCSKDYFFVDGLFFVQHKQ